MPTFNFSPIKKKKDKVHKESNIVFENIKGIVVININGVYSIKVDNNYYSINSKNYSCKGKMIVYSQELTELSKRLIYIRTEDDCVELPHNAYLPFTVGCMVLGNIIKHITNNLIFDIKRVIIDNNNIEAKEAMKFYKENYTEIQANRKKNYEQFIPRK